MLKMKEYEIDNNQFRVKWGFTTINNPESFYIIICGWGIPTYENLTETKSKIRFFEGELKKKIFKRIEKDKNFSNKFIVNFEYPESGIKKDKKTYFSLDLVFFVNNNKTIKDKFWVQSTQKITKIVEKHFLSSNDFIFFKFK
jgi:hypothetical protein